MTSMLIRSTQNLIKAAIEHLIESAVPNTLYDNAMHNKASQNKFNLTKNLQINK